MTALSENIKLYRKQIGLTQKALAQKLKIAPTAVSAWELGRNKPLMDNIEQMSAIFGIKKSVLLGDDLPTLSTLSDQLEPTSPTLQKITATSSQLEHDRQLNVLGYAENELEEQKIGKGNKDTTKKAVTLKAVLETTERLEEPRKIIVLDKAQTLLDEQKKVNSAISASVEDSVIEYHVYEKLSAGEGEAYFEDRNYDVVFFNQDIKHDLASWVYGDSMEPDYIDGSVALIKDTGFDYDGAIYAVDWDGQSYIKKVYKEKDGLRLVSLNDKYADKFASWEEQPRIIGKVVGNFVPLEI